MRRSEDGQRKGHVMFVGIYVSNEMAEYDLSKTINPYLDCHLTFPLLAHLRETSLFPTDEVSRPNIPSPRVPTCLITHRICSSRSTQGRRFIQVGSILLHIVPDPNTDLCRIRRKRKNRSEDKREAAVRGSGGAGRYRESRRRTGAAPG